MRRGMSKQEKEIIADLLPNPEQAPDLLSDEELEKRAFNSYDKSDAEVDAKCHKEAALAQQREGMV